MNKIVELVAAAKAENPKVFGAVPDVRAAQMIHAVLAQIGKQIDATAEGPVPVVGFGRFVVKRVQVKQTQDGATKVPADTIVRRVLFQRAKPVADTKMPATKR